MSIQLISIQNFRDSYRPDLFMIDVRGPAEYQAQHVDGARLYPLNELNPARIEADFQAQGLKHEEPVFVLCQAGMRAQMAAAQLVQQTGLNVVVVEGGTNACMGAGLPIVQG
jgi:rhodanese-related sulfurtransferase